MLSSIDELDHQYGDRLTVIGIDADEDPEVVRSFVEEHDVGYLNLIGDGETLQAYAVRAHPFTVLISPDGQVFRSYVGYTDKAIIEEGVRALLELG